MKGKCLKEGWGAARRVDGGMEVVGSGREESVGWGGRGK